MNKILLNYVLIFILILPTFFCKFVEAENGSFFVLPQYSKRISLDFKNADLKDVLKVFSRQIGANFVLESSVDSKNVTVYLVDVPVEEAFNKILSANSLVYKFDRDTNIFYISKISSEAKVITRVYPLKNSSVPSSKLKSTLAITNSSSSSAGSTSGLVAAIQATLSKDGKISDDPRTNSLIITDVEDRFSQIETVLGKLDISIPQILIEVKILDVNKAVTDKIGVNYGENFFGMTGGGSVSTYFPFNKKNILNKGGITEYTAGTMGFSSMSAVVTFMESQNDTHALARPRILTLDNETAQIEIATDEAIGVKQVSASVGSSSGSTSSNEAERAKTGVFLVVTPQVNLLNNEITIAVSPKVSESIAGKIKDSSGNYFRDTEDRTANIIMRVQAGETVMIAGLLRKADTKIENKVPLLGNIPFLGRLFRYNANDSSSRELVIFITPYIVDNNGNPMDVNKNAINLSLRESSFADRSKLIDEDLVNISKKYNKK